jgi:hypothetical protein
MIEFLHYGAEAIICGDCDTIGYINWAPLTTSDAMTVPEARALVSWMRRHEECRCPSCIDPLLAPFPPTPDDDEVEP